ncbi:hypothetical protein NX02_05425 [Sphingomonas sanxanigenens DSM 19645 = NX02]|uniref:Rap1a immunity protein domain-containing protein n=2 Tax=Sphingomonas sanxanigenens TaxID=397260 RepID=W0A4D7_9SPHN|nr:hypothetical protein NX02_05425 [Sphingomonas sanxanigenens DSM 19645 = NX02]
MLPLGGGVLAQPKPARSFYASTVTASFLAGSCEGTKLDPLEADFCSGYIIGVYDALSLNGLICPSAASTTMQAVAIGRKEILDHPERWDRNPSVLVRDALKRAFPCR